MTIMQMRASSAVLIIAIAVIRALTLYRLLKKTFLALWGVAVCRLLIPFSVPSRLSIYNGVDMLRRAFEKTAYSTSGQPGRLKRRGRSCPFALRPAKILDKVVFISLCFL